MELTTDRLLLRPVMLEDAEEIEKLAGDYEVAKTTANIPHPYPEDGGRHFVLGIRQGERRGKIVLFGIVEKESGDLIGLINFHLSQENKRGELGYFIGKQYWGQGYGTEAAEKMLVFGFEELDLIRVYAAAFKDNPGSWRVMEKIGLTYEGTFKQHLIRDGVPHDVVYYGMTKKQFEDTKNG